MNKQQITQPMLNRAMMEAVDFIHPEGWDCPPTLFALVPTRLLAQHAVDVDDDSPLTLVVQDDLPSNIEPGSEHLADYVSRVIWPDNVVGAVLAQEIKFKDTADSRDSSPRPARLFSGVIRHDFAATNDSALFVDELLADDSDDGSAGAAHSDTAHTAEPEGIEQTLLQLRPTEKELADAGPFAEDDIQLRGGPGIAPGVIAALRHGLDQNGYDVL
ncbi:PPA1309 family protein [Corynebacterium propinquum]|uniref:PPA1309 family protein n=1 Tax=Corynebacterium propinquum TaxID=43769 RepID=UPI002542F8F0|nr:PPA1309 family protein [Corynebacterium propinquum]MDK4281555.1 PPA1309 family protein [Corynebacterium propinquum]